MLTAQLTYEWRMVEFFFLTVENETDRKNETTKRRNELIEEKNEEKHWEENCVFVNYLRSSWACLSLKP